MQTGTITSFDGLDLFYAHQFHPRKAGGRRIHPVVFFIHGMGNNYTAWKEEMRFFYRKGYDVLAMDLRGYGKSSKKCDKDYYKIQNYATDIKTVMDRLRISRCVFAGHSLGGLMVLEFEKIFPKKVQGMVLVDTTYKVTTDAFTGLTSAIAFALFRMIGFSFMISKKYQKMDFSKMKECTDLYILLKGERISDGKADQKIIKNLYNLNFKRHLKRIKVPALIISATRDQLFSFDIAREMQQEIPDAELDVVEATHISIIKKPKTIARLMHEWVERKIEGKEE